MIHMVDAASTEGRDPVEDILTINRELEQYNEEIARRPQVIAANKIDCFYGGRQRHRPSEIKRNIRAKGHPRYADFRCHRGRRKRFTVSLQEPFRTNCQMIK